MDAKLQTKLEAILAYCADKPYAYACKLVDPITYEIRLEHSDNITPTLAVARIQHEIDIWK